MSESHEALELITDQARRLLTEHSTPEHLKELLDQQGAFDSELWNKTNELGWCAAGIAEEMGGIGLGWESVCRLAEVLGEFTVSLPLLQNTLVARLILETGKADATIAEELMYGQAIATLALNESGRSDIPMDSSTKLVGNKLTGNKSVAAFAAVADYALVNATDGESTAIVLVDLKQQSISKTVVNVIDNARAMAKLSFNNCDCIRLDDGNGQQLLLKLASAAAVVTAFEQVGGTSVCIDLAVEYAKERRVFGQAIGAFQAIKHNLADMYANMEIARGCALDALQQLEGDSLSLVPYAAAARVGANKAYDYASKECIQIHGGIGATWEAQPHHYHRRARSLALEFGATSMWRDLLVDNIEMMAEGY